MNTEIVCGKCIHQWACEMQSGNNDMSHTDATHCELFVTTRNSIPYYLGQREAFCDKEDNIAEWIEKYNPYGITYTCSGCQRTGLLHTTFCPHCGRRMVNGDEARFE